VIGVVRVGCSMCHEETSVVRMSWYDY